jgi:RNA polymerase sigma factor for flagellar operon FliA
MATFNEQLHDWWDEYQLSCDVSLRNRLVLALAPMITHIVEYRTSRAPAACGNRERLLQAGFTELMALIEDYRYCEGSLQEFAWARIDRAVREEMRRRVSRLRRERVVSRLYANGAY